MKDLPFHHPVQIESIPATGLDVTITATPQQCAAVARWCDVSEVKDFTASLRLEPLKKTRVRVSGTVRATVTQPCVVTLEPVVYEVKENIALKLSTDPVMSAADLDLDEEDIDPVNDGRIDCAAIALDFFMGGVIPFPRKPGVEWPAVFAGSEEEDSLKPFAALMQHRNSK